MGEFNDLSILGKIYLAPSILPNIDKSINQHNPSKINLFKNSVINLELILQRLKNKCIDK